jgi:RNA polymerase sigma-70 factor (ECF subfamily)
MSVGKVYALCLRLTSDITLAEKLTTETFITTWHNIQFFREDTLFSSWITGITTYTVLGWIRNNGGIWSDLSHNKLKQSKAGLNKKSPNPFEMNIFSLPDKERFVFVLHDIEKYSLEEAADLLTIGKEELDTILQKAYELLIPHDYTSDGSVYIESCLNSLPEVIQPESDIWKNIFTALNQVQVDAKKLSEQTEESNKEEKTDNKGKKFGFLSWKRK